MVQAFLSGVVQNQLFKQGEKVIIGVSGGADSVCLFHLLRQYAKVLEISLAVAHVHHGLRETAQQDLEFVKQLSETYEIPFYVYCADVLELSKREKLSVEAAGRKVRYEFFESLKLTLKAQKIALAHHQNDQAETLLLHLLRGSGLDGLTGMKVLREDGIVRPLLTFTKQDILHYLCKNGHSYREDESNEEIYYTRNKIRLELIPWLEQHVNPQTVKLLSDTAAILSEDKAFLDDYAEQWVKKEVIEHNEICSVNLIKLQTCEKAIVKRVLRKMFHKASGTLEGFGNTHLSQMLTLIQNRNGSQTIHLPHQMEAVRQYNQLMICKRNEPIRESEALILPIGQRVIFGGYQFIAKKIPVEEIEKSPFIYCANLHIMDEVIQLRFRKDGDTISIWKDKTHQATSHKKLQDLFVDLKVPKDQREVIPIISTSKGVLWALGVRKSVDFPVLEDSKEVIAIYAANIEKEKSI